MGALFTPRGIPLHSCKFQFSASVVFWNLFAFDDICLKGRGTGSLAPIFFLDGIIQLRDSDMSFSITAFNFITLPPCVLNCTEEGTHQRIIPLCLFFSSCSWLQKKCSIRLVILYWDGFLPVTNGITFYTQKNFLYETSFNSMQVEICLSMADPMHHIQSPFLPCCDSLWGCTVFSAWRVFFVFFFWLSLDLLFLLLFFLVKPVEDIT